ncbi:MAG: hypothetical protein WCD69_14155, partial [Xanthobacteraceae bacterium]
SLVLQRVRGISHRIREAVVHASGRAVFAPTPSATQIESLLKARTTHCEQRSTKHLTKCVCLVVLM